MSYNAHIQGKPCSILFDKYFDSLNLGHLVEEPRCERIKAVDNNTISILGQITLPIVIDNFEVIATFQIIPDIHIDIIFGIDMMNTHIEKIDYMNSKISFKSPSKACYELMDDTNITLKGFLKEGNTIPPHSEQKCFLNGLRINGTGNKDEPLIFILITSPNVVGFQLFLH